MGKMKRNPKRKRAATSTHQSDESSKTRMKTRKMPGEITPELPTKNNKLSSPEKEKANMITPHLRMPSPKHNSIGWRCLPQYHRSANIDSSHGGTDGTNTAR